MDNGEGKTLRAEFVSDEAFALFLGDAVENFMGFKGFVAIKETADKSNTDIFKIFQSSQASTG